MKKQRKQSLNTLDVAYKCANVLYLDYPSAALIRSEFLKEGAPNRP